jgi:hypothetical protein
VWDLLQLAQILEWSVKEFGCLTLSILQQNLDGSISELVATIETRDLEDEKETKDLAFQLLDKIVGSLGRTTCRYKS